MTAAGKTYAPDVAKMLNDVDDSVVVAACDCLAAFGKAGEKHALELAMLEARPPNAYAGWAASEALSLMGPVGDEAKHQLRGPMKALDNGEGGGVYPRLSPQRVPTSRARVGYSRKITKQTQEMREQYARERVARMEREYAELLTGKGRDGLYDARLTTALKRAPDVDAARKAEVSRHKLS